MPTTTPTPPTRDLRRICVFCGSSMGARPEFAAAARELARAFVADGITLVYGGATAGLMGVLADETLAGGGEVIGIVPRFIADHVGHTGLTELHVTESMAARKALMTELSDGFISLPGGLGTLEELFEMVVGAQLHLHDKPSGVLNVAGYYDHLEAWLAHARDQQLVKPENVELLLFDPDPRALIDRMRHFTVPSVEKWITG
jgi:uncharacterized protein (TIGR00730 family)